jgi:hypothetical protein
MSREFLIGLMCYLIGLVMVAFGVFIITGGTP